MRLLNYAYTLLIIFVLFAACNTKPAADENPENLATTQGNETNSKYVQKGSIITNGTENTYHFLEATSLMMEADVANHTIDSLRTAYKADKQQISTQFALGTHFATMVAFVKTGSPCAQCDSALTLLTQVIEQNAAFQSGAAYFNRAQVYLFQQNWAAAVADFEKYAETDAAPSAYALLGLAKAALGQGDKEKACGYVKEYKAATPGSGDSTMMFWEKRCEG